MKINSPLARRLASLGVIQPEKLSSLSIEQGSSLAETICKAAGIKPDDLQTKASQMFHVSQFDLASYDYSLLPDKEYLNEKLIRKHKLFPIGVKGKTLYIATSDPTDFSAFEDYEFNTGMQTEAVVARYDHIDKAIDSLFDSTSGLGLTDNDMEELEGVDSGDGNKKDLATDVNSKEDDAPIIVYINKILMDAIKRGASDLHFEPYEKRYRIRFRVDGVLHEIASPYQSRKSYRCTY